MKRKIYCPFCCSELEEKDGTLHCSKGESTFALVIKERIMEAINKVAPPLKVNEPPKARGNYRCPNCCGELNLSEPGFLCCSCGFKIKANIHYQLTEREVHKDVWHSKSESI